MTVFSKNLGGMPLLASLTMPMPTMRFGNFYIINI